MQFGSTLRHLPLLAIAFLALAVPFAAVAQDDEQPAIWSGAEGAGQALGSLFEKCDAAMAESGLGYAASTMCLAVARVLPGPTATISFAAEGGVTYTVYSAGDENATDAVTLEITDGDGNPIGTHPDDNIGIVQFGGEDLTQVTIGVSIPPSEDAPPSYCAIAILCEGGEQAGSDEYATAFAKLITAVGAAEAQMGSELMAHENDNFFLFGGVLPPNQGGVAQGVLLEPTPHLLLSAGDENTPQVSCDFSDGGVESYGYSGMMDTVAFVSYTPKELTSVAPMASSGSEERSVLMWMLLDAPTE
jgi:hypothetical protein